MTSDLDDTRSSIENIELSIASKIDAANSAMETHIDTATASQFDTALADHYDRVQDSIKTSEETILEDIDNVKN